jgi:hypothetical protein
MGIFLPTGKSAGLIRAFSSSVSWGWFWGWGVLGVQRAFLGEGGQRQEQQFSGGGYQRLEHTADFRFFVRAT